MNLQKRVKFNNARLMRLRRIIQPNCCTLALIYSIRPQSVNYCTAAQFLRLRGMCLRVKGWNVYGFYIQSY